jgi:A/G-specific adenine glycosylase
MLHAAAKVVAREHGGEFPATVEGLRELPGIGRYTAAAIASIAFGEAAAVVDGNVERVLQRVSGERVAGEEMWSAAERVLDRARPGDFNQAMMELGATVCIPRAPACLTCPVVALCVTRGDLAGAAKPPRQKKREIHYAVACREGSVFLVQRAPDASLMAGMWELPEVDAPGDHAKPIFIVKHSITVTDYTVRVWSVPVPGSIRGEWVAIERLKRIALTGLARKILKKAEILVARKIAV